MAYAQSNGKWSSFYEDERGIYYYRSDVETDSDNNHYVWIKGTTAFIKNKRMDLTSGIDNLNSSVSMLRGLIRVKFDPGYRFAKLVQFTFLSGYGRVLFEVKGETVASWGVVVNDKALQKLGRMLKEQSIKAYEELKTPSADVYNKLLAKIREKQLNQSETEELYDEEPEEDELEDDGITNYKTYEFSYKKDDNGYWTNWSKWEKSDLTISMNLEENIVKVFSPKVQTYRIINHNEIEINESGIFIVPFKFVDNDGVHGTMRLQFSKTDDYNDHTQLYFDYANIMWVYNLRDTKYRYFRNYE